MNVLLKLSRTAATIVLVFLPAAVFGHHSNTEYDQTVVVELEGEVVSVMWKNPHVVVNVAVMEDGEEVVWKLEGSSVSSQRRKGMTGDMIKAGDKVRVAGAASTRRAHHMIVDNLLLPSGQELLLRNNRQPRWPDAQLVALTEGVDPAKAATAEAMGIFRVWTWGRLERGWWFFGPTSDFPLTEAALAKEATWNEFEDNPQLDCTPPGMPNTMGNPYPRAFVQAGDNIEIHQEEFDVVRAIHMNAEPDAGVPDSPLGYSVGRWEDDNTLVISTSNINWPYFNRVGVSQSDAVEVQERFVVDDEAGRLDYFLKVTDPATLTKPYEWKALWVWVPGEEVATYGCTVEE
jgi:hypothetical protein